MTCGQLATNGAPFITYLVVHCTPAIGAERHFRFMLDTTMTALRNTHHSRTNRQYFSRLYDRAFQQCNFLRTFFSLLLLILPIITNKEIVKEQHTRKNSIFHSVCRGPQTQIKCCRLWPRRCRCRRHDSNKSKAKLTHSSCVCRAKIMKTLHFAQPLWVRCEYFALSRPLNATPSTLVHFNDTKRALLLCATSNTHCLDNGILVFVVFFRTNTCSAAMAIRILFATHLRDPLSECARRARRQNRSTVVRLCAY